MLSFVHVNQSIQMFVDKLYLETYRFELDDSVASTEIFGQGSLVKIEAKTFEKFVNLKLIHLVLKDLRFFFSNGVDWLNKVGIKSNYALWLLSNNLFNSLDTSFSKVCWSNKSKLKGTMEKRIKIVIVISLGLSVDKIFSVQINTKYYPGEEKDYVEFPNKNTFQNKLIRLRSELNIEIKYYGVDSYFFYAFYILNFLVNDLSYRKLGNYCVFNSRICSTYLEFAELFYSISNIYTIYLFRFFQNSLKN
ncbi:hypothetical protein BpHYR1_029886 [Brachionus plicatilis]|uniref:Uncharacterized protein n=1 Tax=Brachionus plicatilis TaxID=10195 RepID=A0A3M7Q5B2_BRAPC|nr:hypothetical protein BpHYR1_029886 [Brachionus plicatilis]